MKIKIFFFLASLMCANSYTMIKQTSKIATAARQAINKKQLRPFHDHKTIIGLRKTASEDKKTAKILKKYAPLSLKLSNIKSHDCDAFDPVPCNLIVKRVGKEKKTYEDTYLKNFQPHGTIKRIKVACKTCGFSETFYQSRTQANPDRQITVLERESDERIRKAACLFNLTEHPQVLDITNIDLSETGNDK